LHAFCRVASLGDRACQDVRQALSDNAVGHAYRWRRGEVAVRSSADGNYPVGVVADGIVITMAFVFAESPITSGALVGDTITPVTISESPEAAYSI
jgi:hypothetical protein